jgi:deoxyribodipyrimidine photo-lyase
MSRDQRSRDNWALLYAAQAAQERGQKVAVCFNLVTEYLNAGARQFVFMLRGLQELAPRLEALNVRFHLLQGEAKDTVPRLAAELGVGLLVTDMSPVRLARQWRDDVQAAVGCPVHEVDAHNVVPVCPTT